MATNKIQAKPSTKKNERHFFGALENQGFSTRLAGPRKGETQQLLDSKMLLTSIVAIASILIISLLADNAIHANLIYEKNPCRLVRCDIEGTPLSTSAENLGIDPFTGNVRCKCPNENQPMYEVARTRAY